jgi:hypothetical protein
VAIIFVPPPAAAKAIFVPRTASHHVGRDVSGAQLSPSHRSHRWVKWRATIEAGPGVERPGDKEKRGMHDPTSRPAGPQPRPPAGAGSRAARRRTAVALSILLGCAPAALSAVTITEIHYHPSAAEEAAVGGRRLEWIEVYNDEPTVLDLSGWSFSEGVHFTFPPNTWLEGRSYLVVCADAQAVRDRHGVANAIGDFDLVLDNGSEEIVLSIFGGGPIVRVRYADREPWPAAADGTGHTLALRGVYLDPDDAESWTWSLEPGGTPGAANFPAPLYERPPGLAINEVLSLPGGESWIEIYNASAAAVDLGGYFLSDDRGALARFAFPSGTTIAPGGFAVFDAAASGIAPSGLETTLYLVAPDGRRVVDGAALANAVSLDAALEGFRHARSPDGRGPFLVTTTPTRGAANRVPLETRVVLNEILYHPPREHPELEFIELHNPSLDDVDIGGFRFDRGIVFVFPAGTVLRAGGYLVLAGDPAGISAAHGLAGVLGPWTGALADGGERLRLVDRLGNPVDEVRYRDSGSWPDLADGGGSSLELIDPRQDNALAAAWDASDESTKSRWQEVSYAADYASQAESEIYLRLLDAGEMLIDEISVRRNGTQYVPNGGFETGTSPWKIEGNHIRSRRTTEDAHAGGACLKVVATGAGDTRVNRLEVETSPRLSAGTYTVSFWARWLRGGNLLHISGYRESPEFQHVEWLAIPKALGSPGRANSAFRANLGPLFADVRHAPAVPAPGQPVRVLARVVDADGVASVSVKHRIGSPQGAYQSAALFDDGLHGDGAPADGVYGGELPGAIDDTRRVFYVEAVDSRGAARTFPLEAPARTLVYRHDAPLEAGGYAVRLIHDDAAYDELNARPLLSDELLEATFVFEESEVHYQVGTRYRGSPWNRGGFPAMFRVRFGDDRRWRGMKAINLSKYGNAQNERATYYTVWRNSTPSTTCPMSRGAWAVVKTNDGDAPMELVEPVNGDYLERWFPDDADGLALKLNALQIFDDDGTFRTDLIEWASFADRGPDKARYRWNFTPDTRELEDDFSELAALLQSIAAGDAALDAELEDRMDVEQFLRVYAARAAASNWDFLGLGPYGHNAYFYFAPVEGRWKMLPWDMDESWNHPEYQTLPDWDSDWERVLERPRFLRLYLAAMRDLLDGRAGQPGVFSVGELVSKYLDRNTAVVASDGVQGADGFREFIAIRRPLLRELLPAPVGFAITTNGGAPFASTSRFVDIEGRGGITLHSVLARGEPVRLDWTTTSAWKARLQIVPGDNLLDFFAFDVDGALIGAASISVFGDFPVSAPVIAAVEPASAKAGATLTIEGAGFLEGLEVRFGETRVPVLSFSGSSVVVQVPDLPPGAVAIHLENADGGSAEWPAFAVLPAAPRFRRGDFNLDGVLDISDAVRILLHLFFGAAASCQDAGDVDNNERLELTDSIRILDFLFRTGPPPAAPFATAGEDEGGGPLGCEVGLPSE